MSYTPPQKRMLTAVCEAACISPSSVCSQSRERHVTRTRWCLWTVMHEQGATLKHCGLATGHDHSTVSHGIADIKKLAPGTLYEEVMDAARSVCKRSPIPTHATRTPQIIDYYTGDAAQ